MSELPEHISDLPKIRDWKLLVDTYTNDELREFTRRANNLLQMEGLKNNPTKPSYLVLGNYDSGSGTRRGPKSRLKRTVEILNGTKHSSFAVLLEDIDPANTRWDNWYLKFQFVLLSTDYNVMVAEDNDGGHELELGEVPLSETYLAKREYTHASLDKDIEYEKFDGMMSTLFDFLDRAGHLYRWQNINGLDDAITQIAISTIKKSP